MKEVINKLLGIVFGLAPVLGALVIGFFIFVALPNFAGFIISGTLFFLGIWLGIKIFNEVKIKGAIEFITAKYATPELDNLVLSNDSETKTREPIELIKLIENKKNLLKGGSFRIYGDWFGKPYDNYHIIESAQFDNNLNVLKLKFNEGEMLEIYNPKHISEASTFLKVIHADRIRLTWFYYGKSQTEENKYFLDYKNENKKIETKTNVDWYKPIFDTSLSPPSLIIYG